MGRRRKSAAVNVGRRSSGQPPSATIVHADQGSVGVARVRVHSGSTGVASPQLLTPASPSAAGQVPFSGVVRWALLVLQMTARWYSRSSTSGAPALARRARTHLFTLEGGDAHRVALRLTVRR